jgi:hypothetical protein
MANFQVLCPNRMVGVGQRSHELSDEEAAKTAALWGTNPVHPTVAAYRCMVDQLETNILNKELCYYYPAKPLGNTKMPRVYLSLERAGCRGVPRGDAQDARASPLPPVHPPSPPVHPPPGHVHPPSLKGWLWDKMRQWATRKKCKFVYIIIN